MELELTRVPGERRLYEISSTGTLLLEGMLHTRAIAEAGGGTWRFERPSMWRRGIIASDEVGNVVGEFVPRGWRGGGAIRWGDQEFALAPVRSLRMKYALSRGGHDLVHLDGRGWGKRPVRISMFAHPGELPPELLLFAAFVVHRAAADAGAAAAAS